MQARAQYVFGATSNVSSILNGGCVNDELGRETAVCLEKVVLLPVQVTRQLSLVVVVVVVVVTKAELLLQPRTGNFLNPARSKRSPFTASLTVQHSTVPYSTLTAL